jgi:hypothetical protein
VRPCERGDHSSRPSVSRKLEQPTRKLRRAVAGARSATFPYLALLRVGFTKPIRYRTAGALLPHLFTLTGEYPAVCFLWHFPSLTGPRITRHTALWSSDFPPSTEVDGDRPSACQPHDFMLLTKFCNSTGRDEWNSNGIPVVGWVKARSEAWRK